MIFLQPTSAMTLVSTSGIEVIVVVAPGLGDGFPHGLQTRKVDDGGNLIFPKIFREAPRPGRLPRRI